jgi:hypothetical protein
MEYRVTIKITEKSLFVLLIVISLVSAIGITLAQIPNPGHPWGQIECLSCIETGDLANNAVTSAKIQDGQVGSADLANNAVTSAKIQDDQVTAADLAADSVDSSEIAANAVTSSEIADNAVGNSEIAPGVVNNEISCPLCGTCWAVDWDTSNCRREHQKICTPSGWKRTSVYTDNCP